MSQNNEIEIINLKNRLIELNHRLVTSKNWTSGELEIFKGQIRLIKLELKKLEIK
tara:strand:- start:106 stop:270 length:165 start_codon:yes stop_codon:yes gene_type:complete